MYHGNLKKNAEQFFSPGTFEVEVEVEVEVDVELMLN
jgi:hypothetical protein